MSSFPTPDFLKRPLKILLVTTGFPANPKDFRGIFILRSFSRLLKISQAQTDVLTPHSFEPQSLFEKEEPWQKRFFFHRFHYFFPRSLELLAKGSIIARIKKNPFLLPLLPFLLIRMAFEVYQRSKQCDIIHCQWIISALFPVLFKSIHQKPILLTIQGSDLALIEGKLGRWLNQYILKNVDTLLPMTPVQWRAVQHLHPRIRLAPNGVETDLFSPVNDEKKLALRQSLKFNPDAVLLLYVGMFIEVKGLDLLIDCAAQLKNMDLPPWQILLVGKGEEQTRLEQRISELGLNDYVHCLPAAPPEKIPSYTQAVDIGLSSSHSEGLSTTLCEAAACELPIVATRAGDTDMIVQHNESGYIVENRNCDDYVRYCAQLIQDKDQRKKMGEKGRAYLTEQGLTSKSCALKYLENYQELLESKHFKTEP